MRFLPLFAAIFAITPLAIDMYLPALPQIALNLDAPIQLMQNSISIYLAGYAFGMFLFGPLADRFGRRPLILLGLSGFVVCSILLSYTQNAEQFLLLRFCQAFSGGAATVVIPGAIRHLFGKDTAKGLSYVSMIMMVAPMLAPAVGGYLLLLDEWPLIFRVLAIYGVVMLILAAVFFPNFETETSVVQSEQISFYGRYKKVLGDATCRPYLMVSMLGSIVFFTYITSVSFLYMQVFAFNAQEFSWLFGLNVVAMIFASFVNTRLVPRLGSAAILKGGAFLAFMAAAGFLIAIWSSSATWLVIVCLIAMIATLMIVTANSDALILQHFGAHAGTATAVIGTLRFGCGALAGPLLAVFFDGSALPIAILSVGCLLMINTCLQVATKFRALVPVAHA